MSGSINPGRKDTLESDAYVVIKLRSNIFDNDDESSNIIGKNSKDTQDEK